MVAFTQSPDELASQGWTAYLASLAAGGSTVTPGTAAGNLGKAEDGVAASGDTGVFTLGVRRDGPVLVPTSSAAGDYNEFAVDDVGAMYIRNRPLLKARVTADGQVKGSGGYIHTVTIAATQATPVAGLLTIYDSLTETGTVVLAVWVTASMAPATLILDVACATGIYVGFDATLTGVNVAVSYV